MIKKIIIDPTTNIRYSSFYIKGLYQFFGQRNVRFARSMKFFKDLERKKVPDSHDQYLAFVIVEDKNIYRVIIDYRDHSFIEERAHHWCDVYAKINFNKQLTNHRSLSKIINIPPGFGINIWGFWETAFFCLRNLIYSRSSLPIRIRRHFFYYYLQLKRPKIEEFQPAKSEKNYIFFASTLWSYQEALLTTNVWRKKFVEECYSNEKIDFEGGFYATSTHPDYEKYRNFVLSKRHKTQEYFLKTKKSALVFNTPAVFDCHGWKLPEYLAIGKAIVATPFTNEIPFSLVHGKNIHFVENEPQIKQAINKIIADDEYRNTLEQGAYENYLNHVAPIKVIKKVYEFLINNKSI
jgi:hypothetical protein